VPIVVVRPFTAIQPGHRAEAARAFAAQGRVVGDDGVDAYLWTARALPIVLDAIGDVGAPAGLHDADIVDARVQRLAAVDDGPLHAVAVIEDGALLVEVRIVSSAALAGASDPRDAEPSTILRFGLALRGGSAVHIQRFVVGRS
jgi:hypothetical protein